MGQAKSGTCRKEGVAHYHMYLTRVASATCTYRYRRVVRYLPYLPYLPDLPYIFDSFHGLWEQVCLRYLVSQEVGGHELTDTYLYLT